MKPTSKTTTYAYLKIRLSHSDRAKQFLLWGKPTLTAML